ncbi:MAG TPA: FAD-dependent oxidoreductase [Longimicrobium sp.]|nr:FAD-dependent oxidoreductase [Longimicrobium sp.]
MAEREALVVGAGVIGLTAAVRLREAGWRVRVRAAEPPERTTSAVAAAMWYPYRVGPEALVTAWGERSYDVFRTLAADASTGVRMTYGVELLAHGADPEVMPEWAAHIPDFRIARGDEVPAGRVGWAFTVPVADTAVYLRWLAARFAEHGGEVEIARVGRLEDVAGEFPLVVNCTGLGARELVGDGRMRAVRGQIVRVENPGLSSFWLDEYDSDGLLYIIPRSTDCVLGGTADEGEEDTAPDPAVAERIVRRCAAAVPALAGARVLEHRAGLRPWRPEVRLQAETIGGATIIHNYGHGGAGVSLSWGCAGRVVELARAAAGS